MNRIALPGGALFTNQTTKPASPVGTDLLHHVGDVLCQSEGASERVREGAMREWWRE